MRVLIACEYSGRVRDAFAARGHTAVSCDLLPTENPRGWHVQGDVLQLLGWGGWDLLIAHPPCTHLAVSGARHFEAKRASGVQQEALAFVRALMDAPVPRIALENPVSIISSQIRKPDQTIQPWQFGHGETKATCLWLKGLPLLKPTNIVDGREARVHRMAPSPDRWKERSRTYEGIAAAMAEQWGALPRRRAASEDFDLPAPNDAYGVTGSSAHTVRPADTDGGSNGSGELR
ncbi:DNA cytosine methyltransferase [Ramlibacter sp.]|uniref:DNA cytosine methyltransferase n=1 Tax=Ramlibacter sp. TaxID=1917967 RepID=UPI003D0ABC80